jgi:hypothetical protein
MQNCLYFVIQEICNSLKYLTKAVFVARRHREMGSPVFLCAARVRCSGRYLLLLMDETTPLIRAVERPRSPRSARIDEAAFEQNRSSAYRRRHAQSARVGSGDHARHGANEHGRGLSACDRGTAFLSRAADSNESRFNVAARYVRAHIEPRLGREQPMRRHRQCGR